MKKLWSFFASIYLTVVLAVLICTVAAWGSLISMANPRFSMVLDQSVLLPLLFSAGTRYLGLTIWIWVLIILTAAFGLNTFVCTADKVYAVIKAKKPWQALFPHIVHIGFLVALLGHLAGSAWGFRSYDNMLLKGETKPVPNTEGLYVRLDDFETRSGPDGGLDYLKTTVTLLDGDKKEIRQGAIEINGPLIYKGIAFYHVDQGSAPKGLVLEIDGTTVNAAFSSGFVGPGGKSFRFGGIYPDFGLDSGGKPVTLSPEFVNPHAEVVSSDGTAAYLPLKEPGSSVSLAGARITLVDYITEEFVVLTINKDPGISLIIIGSSILVIGMVLLLFFRGERTELVRRPGPGITPEGSSE